MPTDQSNNPTPTSPEAWGATPQAEEGFVVELPSGNFAKVRRSMNILNLVREGRIPNPLGEIVRRMVSDGDVQMKDEEAQSLEVIQQFAEFLDDIVMDVVLEPPLSRPAKRGRVMENGVAVNPDETLDEYTARVDSWSPPAGTLSVWQIDVNDKLFLFAVAQGAVADAKQFRHFQEESLEPVEAQPKSPRPTKRTGGTGRSKSSKK